MKENEELKLKLNELECLVQVKDQEIKELDTSNQVLSRQLKRRENEVLYHLGLYLDYRCVCEGGQFYQDVSTHLLFW